MKSRSNEKSTMLSNNYPEFLEHMHKKYYIHEYKINNLFHYDTEIDNSYFKIVISM